MPPKLLKKSIGELCRFQVQPPLAGVRVPLLGFKKERAVNDDTFHPRRGRPPAGVELVMTPWRQVGR